MHNIDRVRLETETETEAFESGEFEAEQFTFNETGEVFGETENMELASELLEVSSEVELENFLGDLVAKAGNALGQFVASPDAKALVGVLKGAARKVLPTLGATVGRSIGGDAGARFGSQAASAAGRAFGLELEGLSNEDREFEVARRYVKFAGEAVRNLAENAMQSQSEFTPGQPMKAAVEAAAVAARTHAPGLAQFAKTIEAGSTFKGSPGKGSSGRWVRHGSKIILLGV